MAEEEVTQALIPDPEEEPSPMEQAEGSVPAEEAAAGEQEYGSEPEAPYIETVLFRNKNHFFVVHCSQQDEPLLGSTLEFPKLDEGSNYVLEVDASVPMSKIVFDKKRSHGQIRKLDPSIITISTSAPSPPPLSPLLVSSSPSVTT